LIARWKQPSPTSHDLLVRPTIGELRVEPKQHVEMIIHHREPADGDCEDLCQFFEPVLDPTWTVVWPFAQQEGAAHAARDAAVVPEGHRSINQLRASDCRRLITWGV
jgi:hypothetical protein